MKQTLSKLFGDFFNSEKAGGFILIGCTVVALVLANSSVGSSYLNFWHTRVGFENEAIHLKFPLETWVNDGLMAIFFLLVGLEIKRELVVGELSSARKALLPVVAAAGGMIIPALIHFGFNAGTFTQAGFGIPMATDIAFALGVLSLLGNRVPVGLKVFLTAFAIIDDLGAILVIALFYSKTFSLLYFCLATGTWLLLLLLNRFRITSLAFYLVPGLLLWYFLLQSGIHATISGVLLAFAIPFHKTDAENPSYRLQHWLHRPVAFIILPMFALANTGLALSTSWYQGLSSTNSLGILLGLIVGKPAGILFFCYTAVRLKICQLGHQMNWPQLFGAALLGGIGFTMSIFITLLAFQDTVTIMDSKIAVLASSLVAGLLGYTWLAITAIKKR